MFTSNISWFSSLKRLKLKTKVHKFFKNNMNIYKKKKSDSVNYWWSANFLWWFWQRRLKKNNFNIDVFSMEQFIYKYFCISDDVFFEREIYKQWNYFLICADVFYEIAIHK